MRVMVPAVHSTQDAAPSVASLLPGAPAVGEGPAMAQRLGKPLPSRKGENDERNGVPVLPKRFGDLKFVNSPRN